jgi:hypothetical protein
MNLYKLTTATGALLISLAMGTLVMAADLPKEGTLSGTYTSFGSYKILKVGDRSFTIFDDTGGQVTNGFADHLALHCWGTGEGINGVTVNHGYCVGIDPTGDQLALTFSDEKHAAKDTSWKGTSTYVSGTGKFAGVSGTLSYTNHAREFKPLTEGTYVGYVTFEGNYKLP